ncbi:MAG: glycoside hydrolase family 13 protein [Limnochordaceae bacterium]|nr:glycoside hydrolase family 13 protein [Limnochordaceae bacterium]
MVGVWFAERYRGEPHVPAGEQAGEAQVLCRLAGRDRQWDYWEAELSVPTGRYKYLFWIVPTGQTGRAGLVWAGDHSDLGACPEELWPFEVPHRLAVEAPSVPEWARGAFFYQIFVDRFHNGDPGNDPPGTLPWPAPGDAHRAAVPRGLHHFYGGDLAGVAEKLPYLASLGVDAVYLTPIFRSPSNHKYDTEDYLAVDPAFGDAGTLREMVDRAHRLGIRVVLDLVFNHSGDRFFAFRDVVEKGEASPYREWFFVRRYPVTASPPSYETFATDVASMPKLNTAHPEVRRYLVDVALHWMRHAGVDGFRLDVANEVSPLLWRDLRAAARAERPDVLLIGEIFHQATPWLRGDQWDSAMNYPWRRAVVEFFATGRTAPSRLWERLETLRFGTAPPVTEAMVNLLGSHDTPRFLRLAGGETWRLELATLFQFAYPGVAQVYYGDEVAMDGGDDPDCRRPMEWSPGPEGLRVLELVRALGQWRRTYPCLKTGGVRLALLDDVASGPGVLAGCAGARRGSAAGRGGAP